MNQKVVVITGANRINGIGQALVRTYVEYGWVTIGSFRTQQNSISLLDLSKKSARVHALPLDVTNDESVHQFKTLVEKVVSHIDVLINNAGIPSSKRPIDIAPISWLENQLQVHAVGPIRVTQALLPLLGVSIKKPAKVAVITSVLGSITSVGSGWTHYAPSKTAANALVRQMGSVLRSQSISMFALHPGHVATDIGGSSAPIPPLQSAQGLYQVICSSDMRDAVTFRDYRGASIQW